jgi:hypothetical protein
MKIPPLLLVFLIVCAIGGAFAIGRLAQVASAPPQSLPPAAGVQPPVPVQLVPTGKQRAEIETPQGKFTVEAGVTVND